MTALFESTARLDTPLRRGRVLSGHEGLFRVESEGGVSVARRAVSCLVRPEPEDTVLFCAEGVDGDAYILAVLAREDAGSTLVFDGDVAVEAGGAFRVESREGVSLRSPESVELFSADVRLRGGCVSTEAARVETTCRSWGLQGDEARVVASTLDTHAERQHAFAGESYRQVRGADRVDAGELSHCAESLLHMQGAYTILRAEEVARVEADQIHMG